MAVTNNPRYFTGNFFLEFLEFQTFTGSYVETLEQIPAALRRFPKYGPLWFFCLDVLQHSCFVHWDGVRPSMDAQELETVAARGAGHAERRYSLASPLHPHPVLSARVGSWRAKPSSSRSPSGLPLTRRRPSLPSSVRASPYRSR